MGECHTEEIKCASATALLLFADELWFSLRPLILLPLQHDSEVEKSAT